MISEETMKKKLYMCYLISELLLRSGASSKDIAEATGISKASVKRYLRELGKNKEKFLQYFPNMFSEEKLDKFNQRIDDELSNNKQLNKWGSSSGTLNDYKELVTAIVNIFESIKPKTPDKELISNLRVSGKTITMIQEETGFSRGSIHKSLKEDEDDKGKSK